MVKITQNSNLARESQQIKNKSVDKKESLSQKENVKSSTPGKNILSDSVVISSKGNETTDTVENIDKYTGLLKKYEENQLRNLKDFSEKSNSGHYNKEEVISETSENIVNHPGFFKSSGISPKNSIQDNLARVQQNIESGKYNSDKIIEDVADKLISSVISPLER
ncbi:MAG: hypothetical protein CMF96_01065 [Candidatus Marinimicrobia bacterium]|nr:hypothetical protein [Candidatus Neomarinimicrobiota bacterium]|tara:strand:- start:7308 stop:7802 length:495 start_codon:yes stop_codon:yes gene_type:complete